MCERGSNVGGYGQKMLLLSFDSVADAFEIDVCWEDSVDDVEGCKTDDDDKAVDWIGLKLVPDELLVLGIPADEVA